MLRETDNSHETTSYLAGDKWVLEVHFQHQDPTSPDTWRFSTVEITASHETTEEWNAKFWSMYPAHEPDFRECVKNDGIVFRIVFPFTPTVSLKDNYGGYRLNKIRRIAEYWRVSKKEPPIELVDAISAYQHDQALYDFQKDSAWKELMRRLPEPPKPYFWYHYSGGITQSDIFFFRLWHSTLGYEPRQE